MRATTILGQWCIRTTLFTRPGCSLCIDAKNVLDRVWKRRPFEFTQIDIAQPQNKKWKEIYDFDVPVVHVDKVKENQLTFETSIAAGKLMHRFTETQLEKLMDDEMMKPADDD
ncbi:hypothetical protein AMS68_007165 [Peltaster fructicola]|uniref:Glutaredoxin-like protein n=1 Tax=Peltaster fructicola TaxID=286661 RepID=A0A6H0Y474_9PEZI|nr:hypothetical protein AMS68_007165 [Peltaster fructicola]